MSIIFTFSGGGIADVEYGDQLLTTDRGVIKAEDVLVGDSIEHISGEALLVVSSIG